MEWARLSVSKPWKSEKLRLDPHPETSRSRANALPVSIPASEHSTRRVPTRLSQLISYFQIPCRANEASQWPSFWDKGPFPPWIFSHPSAETT